jgi:hypothetical protein
MPGQFRAKMCIPITLYFKTVKNVNLLFLAYFYPRRQVSYFLPENARANCGQNIVSLVLLNIYFLTKKSIQFFLVYLYTFFHF